MHSFLQYSIKSTDGAACLRAPPVQSVIICIQTLRLEPGRSLFIGTMWRRRATMGLRSQMTSRSPSMLRNFSPVVVARRGVWQQLGAIRNVARQMPGWTFTYIESERIFVPLLASGPTDFWPLLRPGSGEEIWNKRDVPFGQFTVPAHGSGIHNVPGVQSSSWESTAGREEYEKNQDVTKNSRLYDHNAGCSLILEAKRFLLKCRNWIMKEKNISANTKWTTWKKREFIVSIVFNSNSEFWLLFLSFEPKS